MPSIVSFLTLLATVAAHGVRHGGKSHHRHEKGGKYPAFDTWMETQGKEYKSFEEYKFRNRIYERNVEMIANHNAAGLSWNMTVNKFADLTGAEFTSRFTGLAITPKKVIDVESDFKISENVPVSIDWEALGAVTPVKNQEQCGSCWAFSTTGSVEGAWFIAKKQLVSLSEQQLIDCSTAQGNNGCNGGLMDYAFQYIISNGGITSEAQYPYTATGPNTCMAANTTIVATISSYQDVPINSDTALMSAIAQQPVSVAIEADQSVFQFYSGGVMSATTCGTQLDHGVLAVGYGTLNGADYYKVKNSWGADWGLNGYILLGRGSAFAPNGQCGILMAPSFPLV